MVTYGSYDGAGRSRTITDPAGKDTTYTYDAPGRVLTVNLPKSTPAFPNEFFNVASAGRPELITGFPRCRGRTAPPPTWAPARHSR